MPELPEVETIKNDLIRAGVGGQIVRFADVFWHRTLAVPDLQQFQNQIVGLKITQVSRRGKYLIFILSRKSPCFLVMHLRMSGRIDFQKDSFLPRPHDRARLVFENGTQLLFHDTRKFGRWYFVDDVEKVVGRLGMEPLDKNFTADWLAEKMKGKKRMLKPFLLDQTFIAGIGNIYADEALWYARLHPQKNSSKLTRDEVGALWNGIIKAIQSGVKNAGTSMGIGKANFYSVSGKRGGNQEKLQVFRRTSEPCPRCRVKIARILVGQRSTHYCPQCQKKR